jgi:antitoxin component of MazEF toxin-antitoxin module
MNKRLSVIGNSLGVIIDKPILDLLNINRDTLLELKTDGEALIIRPASAEVTHSTRAERIKAAACKVSDIHTDAFEKLAK